MVASPRQSWDEALPPAGPSTPVLGTPMPLPPRPGKCSGFPAVGGGPTFSPGPGLQNRVISGDVLQPRQGQGAGRRAGREARGTPKDQAELAHAHWRGGGWRSCVHWKPEHLLLLRFLVRALCACTHFNTRCRKGSHAVPFRHSMPSSDHPHIYSQT